MGGYSLFSQRLIGMNSNGSTQVMRSGGIIHPEVIVVSRALCGFRRITLPNGSRNAVKAALLQAERDAPSANNLAQIVQDPQDKTLAGLWTWPAPEIKNGETAPSIPRSFPETLVRTPLSSGQRLVDCLDGVEGQVWDDGVLMASRWWPKPPSQSQWLAFMRSARLKTDEMDLTLPPISEVPWRKDLPFLQGIIDLGQSLATPMRLLVVSGAVLGAAFIYSGTQYLHYQQTLRELRAEITVRKEVVSDVLADRNQAVQNLKSINTMARMVDSTALLSGIAGVLEKVQGEDMQISSVSLSDGQLRVIVKGKPEINGAALVKALEDSAAIKQVSIDFKQNNLVEIHAALAERGDQ
jgi:hypothetical protein